MKASNAETNDRFGERGALGDDLVAGTFREDGDAASDGTPTGSNNSTDAAGAAYILTLHPERVCPELQDPAARTFDALKSDT